MTTKTVKVEITGDPSSFERSMTVVSSSADKAATNATSHFDKATSKIGGLFHGLDNQLGAFGIPFTGALTTMGDKLDGLSGKGENFAQKILPVLGGLGLGVAAVAGGIAVESIHLADAFEKANANLETAVKNSGGSMKALQPQIDTTVTKFAALGYNATEVEKALARGTLGTGNARKAFDLMGQAADLAAFKHIDLESAMTAVTKASEGQLRPLHQLGIDLPIQAANAVQVQTAQIALAKATEAGRVVEEKVHDGRLKGVAASDALRAAYERIAYAQQTLNDKASSGDAILKALHEKTMGAAQRQSKTFAGEMKGLSAELENVGIKIGLALIPYVKKFTEGLAEAITWVNAHQQDFRRFFTDVSNVVQTVWKVVQPIYLALWSQLKAVFKFVEDLVEGNWSKIWGDVVSILEKAVGMLLAPAKGIYNLFKGTFDDIGAAVSGAWNGLWADVVQVLSGAWNFITGTARGIWGDIGGAFNTGAGFVSGVWNSLWGGLTGIVSGAWDGVLGAVRGGINEVVGAVNAFIDAINGIHIAIPSISLPFGAGEIGGGSVSFPHVPNVPQVAAGGTFTKGGLALVGEKGPELTYLPTGAQVAPNSALNSALEHGGGGDVHIHVHGHVLDGHQLGYLVHEALLQRQRQNGSLRFK